MINAQKVTNSKIRERENHYSNYLLIQGRASASPMLELPIVPKPAGTHSTSSERSTITYESVDAELASIVEETAKRGSGRNSILRDPLPRLSTKITNSNDSTHHYRPESTEYRLPTWHPVPTIHHPSNSSYMMSSQSFNPYSSRSSFTPDYYPNEPELFNSHPYYISRGNRSMYHMDDKFRSLNHFNNPPPTTVQPRYLPTYPDRHEVQEYTPFRHEANWNLRCSMSSETPSLAESYSSLDQQETSYYHQISRSSLGNEMKYANGQKSSTNENQTRADLREITLRNEHSLVSSSEEYEKNHLLLALSEDKLILSEALCIVRSNVEVFSATMDDINAPAPGRKNAVTLGQVGLRCIHCVGCKVRVKRAQCYPSSISRIYRTITDMKLDHFSACAKVPLNIKKRLLKLKDVNTRSNTSTMQYFKESAKRLDLIDTELGVFFDKDNTRNSPHNLSQGCKRNLAEKECRQDYDLYKKTNSNEFSSKKSSVIEAQSDSFSLQSDNCNKRRERTSSAFTPLMSNRSKRPRSSSINEGYKEHTGLQIKSGSLRNVFDSNGSNTSQESKNNKSYQSKQSDEDEIIMSALYLTNVRKQSSKGDNLCLNPNKDNMEKKLGFVQV